MEGIPAETPLTDRQLLVHVLDHVEDLDVKITVMYEVLEKYRSLLERFAPDGGGDYLTVMQTLRGGRRGRRRS